MINFEMHSCRNRRMRRTVNTAIYWANQVVNSVIFRDKLVEIINEFDYSIEADGTGITGEEMHQILNKSNRTYYVRVYKNWNPFSSTCGYFEGGNIIHLNYWYIKRVGIREMVSTIVHEGIHAEDEVNPSDSYGHGNNSPIGKEDSAPYAIDELAAETYDEI